MSASKRSARRSIGPLRLNPSAIEAADVPSSGSSSVGGSVVDEAVMTNDDNAERRKRRQHRVFELQQQNVSSPSKDASAGLNRLSIGMPTSFSACALSTTDLAKHYTNCIKLSSENKITTKNAFGLHLIDCMAELLKTEDSEMNNFQAYGCTLDASAKIYGYRVDCVHAETQKIASGLSRSADFNKRNLDDSVDGQADGEDPNESLQRKKQKRVNKRNTTIEKNLKNINTNKSTDQHSETDPLFRRTTELFTDGGSGGVVLLHALGCRDDNGELVIDSMDALDPGLAVDAAKTPAESSQPPFDDAVDVSHFATIFEDIASGENHICLEFAEFNFNRWNLEDGVDHESNWRLNDTMKTVVDVGDDVFQDVEPDGQDNYMDHDAAADDDDVGVETPMLRRPTIPTILIEQATTDKRDADAAALMNLTIRGLASERNEYSYFKKDFATAWAGPNHLQMRARGLSTTIGRAEPKTRTKKAAFHIEYSENLMEDIAAAFQRSKIPTRFAKNTRRKWTYDNTTLVEDLHYEIETLQQLFLKKSVKIRQKKPINQSADADLQNYDYHNPNDVENFCPAIDVDNAGRMSTTSGASDGAFSPASRGFPESNIGDFDTQLGGSQDVPASGQNTMLAFTGDNLIQQPRKVGTFEVPHMRAAKRVNIRRLKESIWTLLIEGNSLQGIASEERVPTPDDAKKSHSFNDIYRRLSNHLSVENAANLTFPMAFVCALHITNEKNLELIPQKDMKDFKIYLPPDGGENAS